MERTLRSSRGTLGHLRGEKEERKRGKKGGGRGEKREEKGQKRRGKLKKNKSSDASCPRFYVLKTTVACNGHCIYCLVRLVAIYGTVACFLDTHIYVLLVTTGILGGGGGGGKHKVNCTLN